MVRVQLVDIVILESSKISSSFSAQAGPFFVCLFLLTIQLSDVPNTPLVHPPSYETL